MDNDKLASAQVLRQATRATGTREMHNYGTRAPPTFVSCGKKTSIEARNALPRFDGHVVR